MSFRVVYGGCYKPSTGYEIIKKKKNYAFDVVYTTTNLLGFDYLLDNLADDFEAIVQTPFFSKLLNT